jgi:hypothetical protein
MFTRYYCKVRGFLFKFILLLFFWNFKGRFSMQTSCGPHIWRYVHKVLLQSVGFISWELQGTLYFTCKVHLVPHFEECLLGVIIIKCER